MDRNYLPDFVGIAMTKQEFCFATSMTPYALRKHLRENAARYSRYGVTPFCKLLMPAAVREICAATGLRIDIDYYMQYVARKRGLPELSSTSAS